MVLNTNTSPLCPHRLLELVTPKFDLDVLKYFLCLLHLLLLGKRLMGGMIVDSVRVI